MSLTEVKIRGVRLEAVLENLPPEVATVLDAALPFALSAPSLDLRPPLRFSHLHLLWLLKTLWLHWVCLDKYHLSALNWKTSVVCFAVESNIFTESRNWNMGIFGSHFSAWPKWICDKNCILNMDYYKNYCRMC